MTKIEKTEKLITKPKKLENWWICQLFSQKITKKTQKSEKKISHFEKT